MLVSISGLPPLTTGPPLPPRPVVPLPAAGLAVDPLAAPAPFLAASVSWALAAGLPPRPPRPPVCCCWRPPWAPLPRAGVYCTVVWSLTIGSAIAAAKPACVRPSGSVCAVSPGNLCPASPFLGHDSWALSGRWALAQNSMHRCSPNFSSLARLSNTKPEHMYFLLLSHLPRTLCVGVAALPDASRRCLCIAGCVPVILCVDACDIRGSVSVATIGAPPPPALPSQENRSL